jgi:hypothetical protein
MEKEKLREHMPLGVGISNLGSGSNKGQVINCKERPKSILFLFSYLVTKNSLFVLLRIIIKNGVTICEATPVTRFA